MSASLPFAANLSRLALAGAAVVSAFLMTGCATLVKDTAHTLHISVPDQLLEVREYGVPIARFPISTSKFGLGDVRGSYKTPLGNMEIAKKIGAGKPAGTVFKDRKPTGEILPPNAPGRDPIVTRILWLRGKEAQNRNAFRRYIYIHGTPEETTIGTAASYGCIRMRSADVIVLYNLVGVGAQVYVADLPLAAM